MNLLLWGWNGKQNFGDDLMTYCIVKYLKENYPAINLFILGDYNKIPIEIKKETKKVTIYSKFVNSLPKIRSIINNLIYPYFFNKKFDFIIIGGGSIFLDKGTNALYYNTAKRGGSKIFSLSTSIGPFYDNSAEKYFNLLMPMIDKFSVRDFRSFKYLSQKGLNCETNFIFNPDLGFSISNFAKFENIRVENDCLGIALTQNGFKDDQDYKIIEGLKFALDKNKNIYLKIFCFCTSGNAKINDELLAKDYCKALAEYSERVAIIRYNFNMREFIQQVISCKYFISVRLHSAIVRYSYNMPFIMFPYHQKCKDLCNDLQVPKSAVIEDIELGTIDNYLNSNIIWNFDEQIKYNALKHFKILDLK